MDRNYSHHSSQNPIIVIIIVDIIIGKYNEFIITNIVQWIRIEKWYIIIYLDGWMGDY